MAEPVDAAGLKPAAFGRGGSSPSPGIRQKNGTGGQWYGRRMTKKTGTFLGVPYDWRRPTVARVKSRWWNPKDRRLFTPKSFGWGYDINLARLLRRR